MKGSDSFLPDRLEESLSCDDLFLQYFNSFLDLPAFPLRLQYDRLTGTFHELSNNGGSEVEQSRRSSLKANPGLVDVSLAGSVHGLYGGPLYGAKDDEKERLLLWAHQHRLPLFLQTRLYRELKLCKLFLRPLDYRRGSSRIRGYSRLSMGTTATSFTPNESPVLDTQSIAWTDGHTLKKISYGLETMERSRPTSRTLSLPPDLGGRTWSATAMYDTSATETSTSTTNDVAAWQRRNEKHYRLRRRNTDGKDNVDAGVSDSGLGTTAMEYSTTVGTSAKTRNIGTRADTLGVGSRWESEYSTRSHTVITSSTISANGVRSATSTPALRSGRRYEGKSALRKADSPSKPHRATIILPGSGKPTERTGVESSIWFADDATDVLPKFNVESTSGGYRDGEDVTVGAEDDIEEDDVSGFLEFDDRDSSCDETEVEIESIQKVHQMKLQHIKERLLGSNEGMDSLLKFLSDTAGIHLIAFWLDAEAFKDALERANEGRNSELGEGLKTQEGTDISSTTSELSGVTDEGVVLAWRHRLFRDILDRHKFTLSEEASEQIREAQSNMGLTCHVFGRTQYDALRRLRSYWLPRYIVHCSTRTDFDKQLSSGIQNLVVSTNEKSIYHGQIFLPLLTIGHFVPNSQLDREGSLEQDGEITVQPLETVSENSSVVERPSTAQIRVMSARSAAHHLLLRSLDAEPDAGCPFRQFLIEEGDSCEKNAYDFWVMLEHFVGEKQHDQSSKPSGTPLRSGTDDYPLDVMDAWKVFSNFVWPNDCPRSMKLPQNMHMYARTLENLLKRGMRKQDGKKTIITSSIFRPAKLHALHVLSSCWKKYCKKETKDFYEAREGKPLSTSSVERTVTPPRPPPPIKKSTRQFDEMSTSLSETTTIFSKPWLTDDEDTETDSASTMYSYDVERIRQIATIIRQRGAKKPQRAPHRRPQPPIRRRITTAAKSMKAANKGSSATEGDDESQSSMTSKKKQTKVQFSLPDKGDSRSTSRDEHNEQDDEDKRSEQDEGEAADNEEDGERRKKKKKKSLLHRHPNRMTYQELKENRLQMYFRKYVSQCESMEVQNVFQMYALCDALRAVPMVEVDRRSALANELSRTYLSSTGPKQIAISSEFSSPFMSELPNPPVEIIEALQVYVLPTLNQAAANFSLGFSAALKEYKLDLRSDLAQNATKAELALRTLTLKPSSKRRRALGKHSARQPPTSDHKQSFMDALKRASEGDLPLDLLHFYKYLQGFGNQEGFPLIHNDLLFYVEVSKFIACFHESHDLVTLKRKVQSILDCFITSGMDPSLQIDIKTGTAERLRRAGESFVNDKGRDPHTPNLFEDAQHTVFNELLPFWAGFASARPLAERDEKRPVLKAERLHKRRLEAFHKTPDPKTVFNIPRSAPKFDMHGLEFTFSVNSGIQWKEWSDVSSSRSSSPPPEGIIEIVKMPPKSQNRRMIRRGNFSVKKLNVIQEKPQTNGMSSAGDKKLRKNQGGDLRRIAMATRARNAQASITYTTSVS